MREYKPVTNLNGFVTSWSPSSSSDMVDGAVLFSIHESLVDRMLSRYNRLAETHQGVGTKVPGSRKVNSPLN